MSTTLAPAPVPSPAPDPTAPASPHGWGAAAALAATGLSACGGGGETGANPAAEAAQSKALFGGYAPVTPEQAARFLLQAQFAASDADIAKVQTGGYGGWLQQQFSLPAAPTGWDWLNSRGYDAVSSTTNFYDNTYPADYMVWNQLMTSPDAMRKRVALALSEFFVVSLAGLDVAWRSHLMASYWDTLAAHAFGNYRQLLEAVTLHPAMGVYLNTRGNQKENAATGRQPDENYAREVLQLMSIGLVQLGPDGTARRNADGATVDTYTQSDISNLARVFTGYDFDQSQNQPTVEPVKNRTLPSVHFTRLPMVLTANRHSTLAASFLGTTIAANTEGRAALKTALDTIFQHPNVGPFFGRQMVQRLVTSNPSPAYIARVAAVFNNNGAGVRGDLQAVFAAILLDPEARGDAGLSDPTFGKLREPVLRLVQWGRSFGIQSARGSWKIGDLSNPATQLGQSPLRSPSVFNFFRPGYVPPSSALAAVGAVAPEFQIVTETSVGGYLNYLQTVLRNGIYVNAPELPQSASTTHNGFDITASYSAELAMVGDAAALVQRLNLLLCGGQLSADTRSLVTSALNATAVTAASSDSAKLNRIAAAVLLVMASPEYLVQK